MHAVIIQPRFHRTKPRRPLCVAAEHIVFLLLRSEIERGFSCISCCFWMSEFSVLSQATRGMCVSRKVGPIAGATGLKLKLCPLHARLPRQMALDHVEELEMLLLANRLNKKIQTPRLKLYVVLSIFNTHIFFNYAAKYVVRI
jgi:hypothetical protein